MIFSCMQLSPTISLLPCKVSQHMKLSHEVESFHTFCFSSVSLHLHVISFLFSSQLSQFAFCLYTLKGNLRGKNCNEAKKQTKKTRQFSFKLHCEKPLLYTELSHDTGTQYSTKSLISSDNSEQESTGSTGGGAMDGTYTLFVSNPLSLSLSQVAAGLQVELEIEIFAMSVGEESTNGFEEISHDIEIITETETLLLPVRANILCCLTSPSPHTPSSTITLRTDYPAGALSFTVLFGNTRWMFSKAQMKNLRF